MKSVTRLASAIAVAAAVSVGRSGDTRLRRPRDCHAGLCADQPCV